MKNGDRPAHPLSDLPKPNEPIGNYDGLTKREMFAMAAMQGLMAVNDKGSFNGELEMAREAAKYSVIVADELLKALDNV